MLMLAYVIKPKFYIPVNQYFIDLLFSVKGKEQTKQLKR